MFFVTGIIFISLHFLLLIFYACAISLVKHISMNFSYFCTYVCPHVKCVKYLKGLVHEGCMSTGTFVCGINDWDVSRQNGLHINKYLVLGLPKYYVILTMRNRIIDSLSLTNIYGSLVLGYFVQDPCCH